MQVMSTNYVILLFYITVEAATGGVLELPGDVFSIATHVFLIFSEKYALYLGKF